MNQGKVTMLCQKEEIDHVLGNHKGARDDLVSRFLFTFCLYANHPN